MTCNYEARRRGLYKLQSVREARKICPDVIIVIGEDLTRFRDASKDNYSFLRSYTWSDKVERLGFDEVGLLINRFDFTLVTKASTVVIFLIITWLFSVVTKHRM